MRTPLTRWLQAASAVAVVVALTGCRAAPPEIRLQLVQSVPVETALADPELADATDVWIAMIRGARRSIDLGQFYATSQPGSALETVIEELQLAVERGVRVRMLVSDALMGPSKETLERLKSFVEIRVLRLKKVTGGIIHCKYWVVDDREVYVGSQNFDWRSLSHIHELGLRTDEPGAVAGLVRIFDRDWRMATPYGEQPRPTEPPSKTAEGAKPTGNGKAPAPAPPARDDRPVELVASPPQLNPAGIREALPALLDLIESARTSIRIQLLSYYLGKPGSEWRTIDHALRAAAGRGVSVSLLVSDWIGKKSNHDQLKALDAVKGVTVRVATIPTHSGGKIPFARVIHSKYMVVDDAVLWLGTSNWSKDYFTASRNVELIVRRPALARKVTSIHERLWAGKYVVAVANAKPGQRK